MIFHSFRVPLVLAVVPFLLGWLLPNHYFPWASAYQDFFSFLGGMCLVALVVKSGGRLPVMALPAFCLPLVPFLQWILGTVYFGGDSLVVIFYLYGFAFMIFAGYSIMLDPCRSVLFVQVLAGAFVVGAVISVWIALCQWLSISGGIWIADLPLNARPFANMSQPNNLATFLCMGVSGVFYFYERYTLGRLASGVLVLFLLFGVALTQSRTPWVSCVAVLLFLGCKIGWGDTRLRLLPLLMWLTVYSIFVLGLPWVSEFIFLSASDFVSRAKPLDRLDIWWQLWRAVIEGPIWGYGWNQVSVAQVAVSLSYPVSMMTEHSHNILLDILLWNGPVIGGAVILWVGAWLIVLGCRVRNSESLFALLAVGFVLVHAMFEFPLSYAFFLLPVGLLLGIAASEHSGRYELPIPRFFLLGVLVFGAGVWGGAGYEYRKIEADYQLMRFEAARIGTVRAVQPAPDVVLFTQLREFIRFVRTPATENMELRQITWMREVAHRYPYTPSLFHYSLALGLNGYPDLSREQLLLIRSLHGEKNYNESMQNMRGMAKYYPQLKTVVE